MMRYMVLWVACAGLCYTVASDSNYFPCFRDMCRRGEQYCVEERKRCYLCADVVHLCNTSNVPRDCDSFCVRVLLKEALIKEANTTGQLRETKRRLQTDTLNKTAVIEQLRLKLNTLQKAKDDLLDRVNRSGRYEPADEETTLQSAYYRKMFIIACIVAVVLVMVAVTLAVTSCCVLCPRNKGRKLLELNSDGSPRKSSCWPTSPDHVPLFVKDKNQTSKEAPNHVSPGINVNGDINVARLQLKSHSNHNDDKQIGDPPEYRTFLDRKSDNIKVVHEDVETCKDVNKMVRTPVLLKNIQPTDSDDSISSTILDIQEASC